MPTGAWRVSRVRSGPRLYRYRVLSHHLLLIEAGTIEARDMRAVAGDLVCFRSAEVNGYFSPRGTRIFQMQLEFAPPPRDRLTPWLDGIGPLPERVALGDAFGDARRVFETICVSRRMRPQAHQLRTQAAVLELLAIISGVVDPAPNARAAGWIAGNEGGCGWRRTCERRSRSGSSPTSKVWVVDRFIRDFKQRFGMTPKACRTRARLEEARLIQQDADRSIKSVAYTVGFADSKFFARQFRKHLSARPSDLQHGRRAALPGDGEVSREPAHPPTRGE